MEKKMLISCTRPDRGDATSLRRERARLLLDLEKRKINEGTDATYYTFGGEIELPYRMRDGSLLVTEAELSHEDFCAQKEKMEKVNKTLPRDFRPGESRPKMVKTDLSNEVLSNLVSTFFTESGCLRKSVIPDIDRSPKHGYINFSNAYCRETRNDNRWQIPIKQHTLTGAIPTRSRVESLLSECRLVHPAHETIHDLGILIGGTEDQSIHHDIPRQTTSWLPEDPETTDRTLVAVGGWEYDRVAYNEAMASRYAPSSVLLGMGHNWDIKLGVQKNQTERYGCPEGMCRILHGRDGEEFRIARENEFLVVLETNPGGIFTGDFQHAGVRNFPVGSAEDRLMTDFYDRIEGIVEEGAENEDQHSSVMQDLLTMMCNFPKLNTICRFHCSTEPASGPLRIPRNTVGFVDCHPNAPRDDVNGMAASDPMGAPSPGSGRKKRAIERVEPDIIQLASSIPEVPATQSRLTILCPACNATVSYESEHTLDLTLSQHLNKCQNSRTTRQR